MSEARTAEAGKPKIAGNRVHIGEVVDFGAAPFDFVKGNKMSYFLVLEGVRRPLWGVGLEDAIRDSRIQRGDHVRAEVLSTKSVVVDEPVRDGAGNVTGTKKVDSFRATWEVGPYDRPRVHVPKGDPPREASAAPKDIRNVPAERGAFVVKRAREIAAFVLNKVAGRRAAATADAASNQTAGIVATSAPAAVNTANRDINELLKEAQPEIRKRIQAVRDALARTVPGSEPLKALHSAIFAGLPGAGQYRSSDEGRGPVPAWAVRGRDVESRSREMFSREEEKLRGTSHEALIEGMATRFVAVTKLRAFEYGNMTVAKLDAEKAAERAGLRLDMFSMDRQRLNDATRAAIHNDLAPIQKLMDEHAAPLLAVSHSDAMSNSTWSASYVYGQTQSPPAFVSRGNGAERHSAAASGPRQSRESVTQSQRPAATAKPEVGAASPTQGAPRRNRGPAAAYAP